MTAALDYSSTGPVPEPVAAEIVMASKTLRVRDWWAQPLTVVQDPTTKRLGGSTQIVLGGYGFIEIPADEEAVMSCREVGFIVATLTRWSQDYKLSWSLNRGGAPIGDIVDGKQSPGVASFAQRICSNLKLPPTRAAEILKKHAYRRD